MKEKLNYQIRFYVLQVALLLFFASFAEWQTLHGKVIGVSDGDTITILVDGNTQYKIRLLDIDCPEKKQAYGQAAKKHLSDLIFGKIVEVKWQKIDRNKRILGTIIYDGKIINNIMVADGYAWHFVKYSKNNIIHALETNARQKKIGLWQDETPLAPWDFRYQKKRIAQ